MIQKTYMCTVCGTRHSLGECPHWKNQAENRPFPRLEAYCSHCKSEPLILPLEVQFKICADCVELLTSAYKEQERVAVFHEG